MYQILSFSFIMEKEFFFSSSCRKIYIDLWEGKKLVFPECFRMELEQRHDTIRRLQSKVFNIVNTHSSPQRVNESYKAGKNVARKAKSEKEEKCVEWGRERLFKLSFFSSGCMCKPNLQIPRCTSIVQNPAWGKQLEGKWRMHAKGVATLVVSVVGFHIGRYWGDERRATTMR